MCRATRQLIISQDRIHPGATDGIGPGGPQPEEGPAPVRGGRSPHRRNRRMKGRSDRRAEVPWRRSSCKAAGRLARSWLASCRCGRVSPIRGPARASPSEQLFKLRPDAPSRQHRNVPPASDHYADCFRKLVAAESKCLSGLALRSIARRSGARAHPESEVKAPFFR